MVPVRACALTVIAHCAIVSSAPAQIIAVTQERSVAANAGVSSGAQDGGSAEAPNFGPFVRTLSFSVTGPNGAGADATAAQDSALGSTLITANLSASCAARTGLTFVTGDSTAISSFLFIFNLSAATPVIFTASGSLAYIGRNPDGEPSDLDGMASVRLLDADTQDLISGFTLNHEPGSDSATFGGMLPAGQYVILATTQMHAFSADLLGPPPRSGSGQAGVQFSLTAVPGPGAGAGLVLAIGLGAMRRRR
jgi:hypothetical protein